MRRLLLLTIAFSFMTFISQGAFQYSQEKLDERKIHQWMIERSLFINEKATKFDNRLKTNDRMTKKQAHERTDAIIRYSKKYNYMYSELCHKDIALIFFAIIEVETRFVNFKSLDEGASFGVCSMQWTTAKLTSRMLIEEYNPNKLKSNTSKQIKYGMYYFYYLLKRLDDTERAIVAYNTGPNLTEEGPQWRRYFFLVNGKINYYKKDLGVDL